MSDAPAPKRSVPRLLATLTGLGLLVAGVVGIAAHFSLFVSTTWTLVASFTPYFIPLLAVALVLLLLGRQRLLAVVATVAVAAGVYTQVPLYRAAPVAAAAPSAPLVRLMQANIYLGQADLAAVVRIVEEREIDILTVSELTGSARDGLAEAGLERTLPYSFTVPRGGGGGTGIYSRYPLSDGQSLPGFEMQNVRATVAIPGTVPTAVYALHPLAPYPEPAYRWMAELREIGRLLAEETKPVLVGADFNSTFDHRQYRRVLDGASAPPLRDAAVFTGAGMIPTYPAHWSLPAVLAIDRILTRGGTPMSFSRIELPGSDHYGVLGEIRLDGSVDA